MIISVQIARLQLFALINQEINYIICKLKKKQWHVPGREMCYTTIVFRVVLGFQEEGLLVFIAWLAFLLGGAASMAYAEGGFAIPRGTLLHSGLDTAFVAYCALFIAVILLWATIVGKILSKFLHLPSIAGQIIGGLLLGPSCLDICGWRIFTIPVYFIDYTTGLSYSLISSDLYAFFIILLSSVLTVSYLLWIAGHETDVRDILKVGRAAISAGFLGAVLPIVLSWIMLFYCMPGLFTSLQAIGMGLVLAATSVTIPVAMLFAKNMMHLRSSKATLGAAIIDDILAVILLSAFFIGMQSGIFGVHGYTLHGHQISLSQAFLYMVGSFFAIFIIGYYVIPPIISWLGTKKRAYLVPAVANSFMLLYFAFAELVGGLAGITGAYFAGVFHRQGDDGHHAEKIISPFVHTILLPVFLGSIGLQVDLSVLSLWQWALVGFILIIAILSKLLACYAAIWISNWGVVDQENRWTWLDGFLFGSSMIARGEVGLVVSTILRGSGLLSQELYSIAIVVIVLTTIAAPIMLALGLSVMERAAYKEDREFSLTIGPFKQIGTIPMFDIIVAHIGATQTHMTVSFSRERRIVSLDGERVKIILCPQEGIIFEGDKGMIKQILTSVQQAVAQDSQRLQIATLQE